MLKSAPRSPSRVAGWVHFEGLDSYGTLGSWPPLVVALALVGGIPKLHAFVPQPQPQLKSNHNSTSAAYSLAYSSTSSTAYNYKVQIAKFRVTKSNLYSSIRLSIHPIHWAVESVKTQRWPMQDLPSYRTYAYRKLHRSLRRWYSRNEPNGWLCPRSLKIARN